MTSAPEEITLAGSMSRDLATLRLGDRLDIAGNLMRAARIRHLPVVDGQGRLVGLVTHRDLLSATLLVGSDLGPAERLRALGAVPVEQVMQRDVRTVKASTPVIEAAELIVRNKYGCLPVVDDAGNLEGLVTEHDFVLLTIRLLARGPAHAGPSEPFGA